MHGLPLADVSIEEGISCSVPVQERPVGGPLFAKLKAGDVVIAPKLDRLFRSALDALQVVEDMRKRGVGSAGRGWPSPRTWEMAGRLMAAAGAAGASDEARSALIRGAVGDGAGVELLAWLVEMDLPDPEQVLADPASFRLPERGDRAYAALASIASAVASNPTPERWTAGWQVLGLAADAALDMAAAAARVLARCRPDGAALPEEVRLFAPVLRAAGLLNG